MRSAPAVLAVLFACLAAALGSSPASAGDVAGRSCDLTASPVTCPRADLHGRDLRGVSLRGARLHQADLRGAVLSRVDLRGVDLRAADLRGAVLIGADLRGAHLGGFSADATRAPSGSRTRCGTLAPCSGADLRKANLTGANLQGADLADANLAGANLTRANLLRADLDGANLTGATMHFAICSNGQQATSLYQCDVDGS